MSAVFDSDMAAARYIVKAASVGDRKSVHRSVLDIEARELLTGRNWRTWVGEALLGASRAQNKVRIETISEAARFLKFVDGRTEA